MDVLATLLALVAVVLAAVALISRRAAQAALQNAAAAQRSTDEVRQAAESERIEADAVQESLRSELDAADAVQESLRSELDAADAVQESLRSELEAADAARASLRSELDAERQRAEAASAASAEFEQLARTASAETDRADAAEALAAERGRELDALTERIALLEARSTEPIRPQADPAPAAGPSIGEGTDGIDAVHQSVFVGSLAGAAPAALWDLEMARSERTWRHSVALDPSAPSPFIDAVDPLKLAVEIEAAALREEVGAFVSLNWNAEPVADPVRRLLVLRVANELLASAARLPHPFTMNATGSDEIVLEIRSTDEADRIIDLRMPDMGSDAVTFRTTDEAFVAVLT